MHSRRSTNLIGWVYAVAILTLAGSLWLSMGMSLKACPLCFYQRTFVMGIVSVLTLGLLMRSQPPLPLSLLCLPMSAGALGVATFHVSLELRDRLECPLGVFGIGTAPQQALVCLLLLFVLIAADAWRAREPVANRGRLMIAAVALGGVLAWASVKSSPAPPPAPTAPYDRAPDVCRPPHLTTIQGAMP